MATLIDSRGFAGNITWVRNHAEKMRDRLVQSVAFMLFHVAVHGNKQPIQKWVAPETGLAGWVRDIANAIPTKRVKDMTEEQAIEQAFKIVMFAYADREERNRIQRERRAASVKANPETGEQGQSVKTGTNAPKPSAPKKADQRASSVTLNALIVAGESQELTAEEVKVALEAIAALRASKADTSKPANTAEALSNKKTTRKPRAKKAS